MLDLKTQEAGNDPVQNNYRNTPWLTYVLVILLVISAFFSGLVVGKGSFASAQEANIFTFFLNRVNQEGPEHPDLSEFWKVWDTMKEKYAGASSSEDETLVAGAIAGMVKAYGDPYTVYLPPEAAESFDEVISGNFSGVGMEIGMQDGLVTVIAPLPGTPAEKAGILAGDVIVSINSTSTEDMLVDQAVQLIRGEKGTTVALEIYREGESEFRTISVVRDTILIPTVKVEKIGDTFILSIYSFNGIVEEEVRNALRNYSESKAKKLIIDLRGNPGGYLQSAVAIASYFLPPGKVVVEERFGDGTQNEVMRSRGNQIQEFNPQNLVILVDKGSASASEILAGALKDHQVATIIGTQTFGKGSVQELVKLDGGSSLKVTVAKWYTPNGVSISESGLLPDISIDFTAAERLAGDDPQKTAALRFLKGEKVVSETFEDSVVKTKVQ